MPSRVLTSLSTCFRAKVKCQGKGRISDVQRSILIRGSALPSAAKSNKSHYQSKVFVCMSVIRGRIQIIVRMQSIGFKLLKMIYMEMLE